MIVSAINLIWFLIKATIVIVVLGALMATYFAPIIAFFGFLFFLARLTINKVEKAIKESHTAYKHAAKTQEI